MEFNDETVKDYKFDDLDKDTFGENKKGGSTANTSAYPYSTSYGDDGYGKSAYMLLYERRRKKDVKIVVPEDKVDQAKKDGFEVSYDE